MSAVPESFTKWESADKLIKKRILDHGIFSNKPTEKSVCHVYVTNPQSSKLSLEQMKNDLHSDIIAESTDKVIVIGEACSVVDRLIERAIETMSVQERSVLTLQVPLDSSKSETVLLSIEIELSSVEFYKRIWEWTPQEKYDTALMYKEKGVELFKSTRHVDAFHKWSRACKILITLEPLEEVSEGEKKVLITEPLLKQILDLKLILYNNMAECQLLRENYDHVITLGNKVLNKDTRNVKALYRIGLAHGGLKNYEEATNSMKTILTYQPKNMKAQEKFELYNDKWQASVQGYKNLVQRMFKT
ncbi:hypothetical protein QAD02_001602 [Eretmocerus hayati]|uniref:Uncharacterized protein n=1 Tax=Eretmocerus hayati TaxID=131215 RepID=A0ACC2NGM6_9HYME|nr:hypothetical protein QAD02_001602 [Eretmocerus hayati]